MSPDVRRASGILLHPTSLPGPHGIGDLGEAAQEFLEFLSSSGQGLWQVLPLGPTGYGDSPYACFSSFAGNPLLINLDALRAWGLLDARDLAGIPRFSADSVDYGAVYEWKIPLLRKAASAFLDSSDKTLNDRFGGFRAKARWLPDFSLFMALKAAFGGGAWNRAWDRDIALRDCSALERWRTELADAAKKEEVIQFFFFQQWEAVRRAAAGRGIRIVGDMPIFAAEDSADVWANRGLFLLDENGHPTLVAGVPPDYFSSTGQLWGNPLYDWDALKREGFSLWVEKLKSALEMYDFLRIDHFRGFESCWAVTASLPTAERGKWMRVPGVELFEAVKLALGDAPIVAEDLGVITPEVEALRERFGFPGMRILQFAFDKGEAGILSSDNRFLPHNHARDCVVYTGTHDNDTTMGWYESRTPEERAYLDRYADSRQDNPAWRLIRMAMASVAGFCVIPLQDVLVLGRDARMNMPGTVGSNWRWRFAPGLLSDALARRLRGMSELYGRA